MATLTYSADVSTANNSTDTASNGKRGLAASTRMLWIFNATMVVFTIVLALVDQKGPFGDAAKWFFCALLFSFLKYSLSLFCR